jgi:hypothetical protein
MFASLIVVAAALASAGAELEPTAPEKRVQPPPHQVIAIYFHRTARCPTCKRIGALAEEAVANGFPEELKRRAVEFCLIDFQDEKNGKLAKGYKIEGPTLVLANVFDGKVVRWTPMPKTWQLVGKPKEFHAYVREGIVNYLRQTKEEAESKE